MASFKFWKTKKEKGGSMNDGVLLMTCIIIFTLAIMSIFLIQAKEPKKFDKQGMVKYNDNDY